MTPIKHPGTQRKLDAAAIAVWDNEGGAAANVSAGHQFGRRIETDRSWTVYHVFTGIPANADGASMTGLTRSDATHRMMSLNTRFKRSAPGCHRTTAGQP